MVPRIRTSQGDITPPLRGGPPRALGSLLPSADMSNRTPEVTREFSLRKLQNDDDQDDDDQHADDDADDSPVVHLFPLDQIYYDDDDNHDDQNADDSTDRHYFTSLSWLAIPLPQLLPYPPS
jgi:hypothetical protein